MSPLRQRMKDDLAIRGLAPSTQQSYLKAVERLARHYGKRPDRLSSRDVQRFLLHLHEVEGLSQCGAAGERGSSASVLDDVSPTPARLADSGKTASGAAGKLIIAYAGDYAGSLGPCG